VRRRLSEIAERADLWLGDLSTLPFDNGKLAKFRRVVDYRRRRISGRA